MITEHEMNRRKAMVAAQSAITDAMSGHSLTALEWLQVLNAAANRMVWHGLHEEWNETGE